MSDEEKRGEESESDDTTSVHFLEGDEMQLPLSLEELMDNLKFESKSSIKAENYNCVPPPKEHIEITKHRKVKVLIVGTPLTAQTLDGNHLGYETNTQIIKMKLFTISGGPYRPDLNLKSKLTPDYCQLFDIVLVETGVNDISNLSETATEVENQKILTTKVKELVVVAKRIAESGTPVILLKRITRLDKMEIWNRVMDHLMENEVSLLKNQKVTIRDLGIKCEGERDEEDIFGKGRICDGIHFRGEHGRKVFTESFVKLIRSLMVTKVVIN